MRAGVRDGGLIPATPLRSAGLRFGRGMIPAILLMGPQRR